MNNPRTSKNPQVRKWGITVGLSMAYFLAFPGLFREFGTTTISLGFFPVALAGWFFGTWGGVIASLAVIAINSLILTGMHPQVGLPIGEIWPDFILLVWTGLATGYLHKTVEERAVAENKLHQRLREAQALSDISRALSETEHVGLEHVLQLIVDSARELLPGTEQAVIHLLDDEHQVLVSQAVSGFENPSAGKLNMRLGEGVAGQVIETGEVVSIADVDSDSRFLPQNQPTRFRSLMVAPVESGEKRLGTISVQSEKPNAFTSSQQALLRSLGTQAAIAIENARLLETTRQGLKEVNALYRITQGLAASLETEQLMKDVVNLLQQNFGYYQVQIYIIAPQSEELVMQNGSGKIGELLKGQPMPAGAGIVGYTAETGEPFFTNDVDKVVFFVPHPLLPDTKSELAMPIKVNNRVLGVLDIQQCPPGRLTGRDLQLVSTVAEQLAVALQKADLYSNLQKSLQQEKAVRSQLIQSERLALVGRLLASVSHELNNPLQAIQNALFLLKEERGISAQGQQDLQIVLSEAERMAALLERLRTSYHPTRKEDFQTIQLNSVVDDIHTLVSTHLRHNQIAFEFHPSPDLPLVLGLPDQIRQVVLNLLMNAVEVMPSGGRIIVTTEWAGSVGEVSVSVSDTGPGIDPEIIHSIFDAFVTNKETGTGLGLTITYDIIHRHNGRIIAQNAPGGGAIFTFWIPTIGKDAA
jgi:signal transduction histidine kinase